MDLITMEKLNKILAQESDWCVSLFMPTHRGAGRETEQDPILLKNLLREAEERLVAKDLTSATVQGMLKEPQRLLEDCGFWQH